MMPVIPMPTKAMPITNTAMNSPNIYFPPFLLKIFGNTRFTDGILIKDIGLDAAFPNMPNSFLTAIAITNKLSPIRSSANAPIPSKMLLIIPPIIIN